MNTRREPTNLTKFIYTIHDMRNRDYVPMNKKEHVIRKEYELQG